MSKKHDIQDLKNLESERSNNLKNNDSSDDNLVLNETDNKPNILDGYIILENYDLPQNGETYPEYWKFAYRCPTSKEVANFSTLNEKDQPAIIAAIEDLIRKCVVIYDTKSNRQISTGQINDGHRTFFLLLLREQYLPGSSLTFKSICTLCKEPLNIDIKAKKLKFAELNEKLINAFDGRKFKLEYPGVDEPISFLIPTIDISSRVFKHIVKVYRDNQNDKEKKEDKIVYDKQFLLLAPYLYENGTETIKELSNKFSAIQKNEKRFKAYLDIATKLKLDNYETIDCECENCRSVEEAELRFPGGWKYMFVSKSDNTGYFD